MLVDTLSVFASKDTNDRQSPGISCGYPECSNLQQPICCPRPAMKIAVTSTLAWQWKSRTASKDSQRRQGSFPLGESGSIVAKTSKTSKVIAQQNCLSEREFPRPSEQLDIRLFRDFRARFFLRRTCASYHILEMKHVDSESPSDVARWLRSESTDLWPALLGR